MVNIKEFRYSMNDPTIISKDRTNKTSADFESSRFLSTPSSVISESKKFKIVLFSPRSGHGHRAAFPLALLSISRFLSKDDNFEIVIVCSNDDSYSDNVLAELHDADSKK